MFFDSAYVREPKMSVILSCVHAQLQKHRYNRCFSPGSLSAKLQLKLMCQSHLRTVSISLIQSLRHFNCSSTHRSLNKLYSHKQQTVSCKYIQCYPSAPLVIQVECIHVFPLPNAFVLINLESSIILS